MKPSSLIPHPSSLAPVAIVLLGLSLPSQAAPPYAFPDQPGALSPAEIEAAGRALRMVTRNAADYQLVASGRRGAGSPLPGYAVFAMPPTTVSDRIAIRRQIVCNYTRVTEKWQCSRSQVETRVQSQGAEHVFSLVTLEGAAEDGRTAGEVVDFMHSPCFSAQYKALVLPQAAPPPHPLSISSVIITSDAVHVMTGTAGAEDTYDLARNVGKKKQECAFNVTGIHLGKGGALLAQKGSAAPPAQKQAHELTEKAAREHAERIAQEQEKQDAGWADARRKAAEWDAKNPNEYAREKKRREQVGLSLFLLGLLGSLATFFAPLFAAGKGRSVVAAMAIILAAAGTFLPFLHMAVGDAGHELLISGVAVVLSWVAVAVFVLRAVADREK